MLKTKLWLLPLLWLAANAAQAAAPERMQICYRYGCKADTYVNVDAGTRARLQALFQNINSAAAERDAVRDAVQQLYLNAGAQSPIYQDKGGNFRDGLAEGRMDCADHSTNTTTYLHYLLEHGWLRFHQVLEPVWRAPWLVDLHYSAAIEDLGDGLRYAVDSWFLDHGLPAVVLPLADWNKGWSP